MSLVRHFGSMAETLIHDEHAGDGKRLLENKRLERHGAPRSVHEALQRRGRQTQIKAYGAAAARRRPARGSRPTSTPTLGGQPRMRTARCRSLASGGGAVCSHLCVPTSPLPRFVGRAGAPRLSRLLFFSNPCAPSAGGIFSTQVHHVARSRTTVDVSSDHVKSGVSVVQNFSARPRALRAHPWCSTSRYTTTRPQGCRCTSCSRRTWRR